MGKILLLRQKLNFYIANMCCNKCSIHRNNKEQFLTEHVEKITTPQAETKFPGADKKINKHLNEFHIFVIIYDIVLIGKYG